MAVYVGIMFDCISNSNWRYSRACHLFADTLKELHEFARSIGLKRSWFQHRRGGLSHYDLTTSKRRQALKEGAKEADRKLEGKYIREARSE